MGLQSSLCLEVEDPPQLQLLSLLSDTKCFGERRKGPRAVTSFSTLRFYMKLDFGFRSVQVWRQSNAAEAYCSMQLLEAPCLQPVHGGRARRRTESSCSYPMIAPLPPHGISQGGQFRVSFLQGIY